MLTLQLERIGDRIALILDETACAALNAREGDLVHLRRTPEGALALDGPDADYESRHERSRAFLKRYRRILDAYTPGPEDAAQS
jgi:hypothetical protein